MKPSYLWVNTFQGSITMKFPLQKTCLSFFNKQTDFITFGIFSVHLYYLLFWKLQRSCFKGKMYGIELIWSTDLQLAQPPLGHGLFESLSVGILCCLILPAKEDEHMVISQAVHSPPPPPRPPLNPSLPVSQSRDVFGIWRVADKILWIQLIIVLVGNMSAEASIFSVT